MWRRALKDCRRPWPVLLVALILVPAACGGPKNELPGPEAPDSKGAGVAPLPRPAAGGRGMIHRFDENGDGVLTAEEVPEPSRARVMAADADGDGAVTAAELSQGQGRMRERGRRGPGGGDGTHLIRRYDANGDGQLSQNEIPDPMRPRLNRADANGDGIISEGELSAAHDQLGGAGPGGGPGHGPGRGRGYGGGRGGPRSFERLDKNADGKLSPEEIPAPMREEFMQADTNADGMVSRKEAESYQRTPGPPQ